MTRTTSTLHALLCAIFIAAVTAATLLGTPTVTRDAASWGTRAPSATV